jgi:hypothetical protein
MNFKLFSITVFTLFLLSCDNKKASVAGKVIDKNSGLAVENALVNFIQCQTNDENCSEIVIGQIFTNRNGEFAITEKRAYKSKKKWITVYLNNKKIAQKDNIGLNDNSLIIEVTP